MGFIRHQRQVPDDTCNRQDFYLPRHLFSSKHVQATRNSEGYRPDDDIYGRVDGRGVGLTSVRCSVYISAQMLTTLLHRILKGYDSTRFMELAHQYGPSPRTLISITDDPCSEVSLLQEISSSANALVTDLSYISAGYEQTEHKRISWSFVFLRLHPQYLDRQIDFPYIPTPFLLQQWAKAMQKKTDVECFLTKMYMQHYAGWFFEGWMHSWFRTANQESREPEIRWEDGTASTLYANVRDTKHFSGIDELRKRR